MSNHAQRHANGNLLGQVRRMLPLVQRKPFVNGGVTELGFLKHLLQEMVASHHQVSVAAARLAATLEDNEAFTLAQRLRERNRHVS